MVEHNLSKKFFLVSISALFILTFLLYSNTIRLYFLTDDWIRLALLRKYPSLLPERQLFFPQLLKFLFSLGNPGHVRPLVGLIWMLDYSLFHLNPVGYHIFNIFVHFLNAVLVMLLFYSITSDPEGSRYFSKRYFALLAGILFAVHPINVEAVTWISAGIDNLYCSFFYLISILGFVFYLKKEKFKFLVLSLVAFIFALITKELAITLPFVIVSYGMLFAGSISLKKVMKMSIPYFVIFTVYWICRYKILGEIGGMPGAYSHFELRNMIMTLTVKPYYWLVFPFNRLVFHNHIFIKILLGALVGLSVAGAIFNKQTWDKKMLFAILWIFLLTIPHINLLEHIGEGLWHSRFLYFQCAGFCMLIAHLLSNFSFKNRVRQIFQIVLATAFIVSYMFITIKNNSVWDKRIEPLRKISEQIKSMHPEFPDGSRIYTPKLPYVPLYLGGIEYAILLPYNNRIYVFAEENYQGVYLKCLDLGKRDYVFYWNPDLEGMEDVSLKLKELLQKIPQSLPNWNFTKADTSSWIFGDEIISSEIAIPPGSVEQIEIKMKAPSIKSKTLGVSTLDWTTNKEHIWNCFYPIKFSIEPDNKFHIYKISLFPCLLDTITRIKLSFDTFRPKETEIEYIRFLPFKEYISDEISLLNPPNNALLSTPPTFEWASLPPQKSETNWEGNYMIELFTLFGTRWFYPYAHQNNKLVWPTDMWGAWHLLLPGTYYWRVIGEDSLTVRQSELRCFIKK